ncbi:hypothetical protein [Zavarzinella formosa]|uniref:hypothetical protein n=1 Tax=Zavarzinella formosa TaxID=360055 RepID=UPI0002D56859|nr:hypothetical protein [Zavarzinella formosa]
MGRLWIGAFAFLASAMFAMTATSQPPEGKKDFGPDGKKEGKKDGPPPRFAIGKVMPPHVKDELNLTDAQVKQIEELEAKVRAALEKILTPEQIKKAESVGPPSKKDFGPEGKRDFDKKGPPAKDE